MANTKLTYVGRERRTAKVLAYTDVIFWLHKYPFPEVVRRVEEKQAQWERELAQDRLDHPAKD